MKKKIIAKNVKKKEMRRKYCVQNPFAQVFFRFCFRIDFMD